MSGRTGRIGVVPARYGKEIVGGAEIVLSKIAQGLQGRGWDVEVLTTCALDHFSWDNVVPAGLTVEDGMPVRRFPAVVSTPGAERAQVEAALHAGAHPTLAQQERWMNDGMRVPELWHHLLDHGGDYRAVLLGPYLFWPAFACATLIPERSVLWTCLHDEPYAYLELFEPLLSGVAGLLFQSPPEVELAERLVPRLAPHELVGCGVEVPERYDVDGFRRRYDIPGRFVLYAGRREGAKGWDDLLRAFASAHRRRELPFSLVTMGAGPVDPPDDIAHLVRDVGFLPDDMRDAAFAAADAYVQPSRWEAFSRTIMEAWLAGTPVIANGASDVVRYHCETSGAGLLYADDVELEECLAFVADAPAAAALAAPGREYVLSRYTWDRVLDRIEAALDRFTPIPDVDSDDEPATAGRTDGTAAAGSGVPA